MTYPITLQDNACTNKPLTENSRKSGGPSWKQHVVLTTARESTWRVDAEHKHSGQPGPTTQVVGSSPRRIANASIAESPMMSSEEYEVVYTVRSELAKKGLSPGVFGGPAGFGPGGCWSWSVWFRSWSEGLQRPRAPPSTLEVRARQWSPSTFIQQDSALISLL
jgi:hypothetical protein